jgi:hypothetical protein
MGRIADRRIGTRTTNGTEWPVEDVLYRNGPQDWRIARRLCNGVPDRDETYATRGEALAAFGAAQTCQCCGGAMPDRSTWERNRDRAGECDGSVDSRTGRCRAWLDASLWQ